MLNEVFDLMDEVTSVCDSENVDCFISGELVYNHYHNIEISDEFCYAALLVHAKDVNVITRKLQNKYKDRSIESLGTNPMFPGYYIRYSIDDSVDFSPVGKRRHYNAKGIGINIFIISGKKNKDLKDKVLNVLQRLFLLECKLDSGIIYFRKTKLKKTLIRLSASILYKLISRKRIMKSLYNAWLKLGSNNSSSVQIALWNGKYLNLKRNVFENKKQIEINGHKYYLMGNISSYISGMYGIKPPLFKELCNTCVSNSFSWESLEKELELRNINYKGYFKRRFRYLRWRGIHFIPYKEQRTYYYSTLFCTGDRMRFIQLYDNDKVLLVKQLFNDKKWDELSEMLSEYREMLHFYNQYSITFCFNKDIFEIALKLELLETMMNRGNIKLHRKFILKLIKNLHHEHLDSIDLIFGNNQSNSRNLINEKKRLRKRIIHFYNSLIKNKRKLQIN